MGVAYVDSGDGLLALEFIEPEGERLTWDLEGYWRLVVQERPLLRPCTGGIELGFGEKEEEVVAI